MSASLMNEPPTPTQQVLSLLGKRLATTAGIGAVDVPMTFLPPFGEVVDFFSILFLIGYWLIFLFRAFRILTSGTNGDGPGGGSGRPPTLHLST